MAGKAVTQFHINYKLKNGQPYLGIIILGIVTQLTTPNSQLFHTDHPLTPRVSVGKADPRQPVSNSKCRSSRNLLPKQQMFGICVEQYGSNNLIVGHGNRTQILPSGTMTSYSLKQESLGNCTKWWISNLEIVL